MKKRISVFSIVCLLLAAVSLVVVLYRMWWGEDLLFDWPRWMGNPFWFSLGASIIARPLFEASVAGGAKCATLPVASSFLVTVPAAGVLQWRRCRADPAPGRLIYAAWPALRLPLLDKPA